MASPLVLLERGTRMLRILMSSVVVILFCVMLASVLIQVGGRYVFNYSIAMAAELATFSQIWLVLLGSGVAMARSQHVAIDLLPAMLPRVPARIALLTIAAVTLAFLAVLAWGSQPLLRLGMMQTSSAMHLPMWVMYACLPVGAAYIALELIVLVVSRWDDPFPPLQDIEAEAGR